MSVLKSSFSRSTLLQLSFSPPLLTCSARDIDVRMVQIDDSGPGGCDLQVRRAYPSEAYPSITGLEDSSSVAERGISPV